jgi:nitroimidazol reductase NimA-like FMN-containing flavoprotein (pyridoxamine 5'-phosphate oxidase superfamily)
MEAIMAMAVPGPGGVSWSDEIDSILGGDLTAALAYATPAGGAVATAIAPIGLRDRAAGTVGFTTSLGVSQKLERIRREPRIALAYHTRKHGLASSERFVLVQGTAEIVMDAQQDQIDHIVEQSVRYLGSFPRRPAFFWDRWLREYTAIRVPVIVTVTRIVSWPDLSCNGTPDVLGAPPPTRPPASQRPPKGGTAPRVATVRMAKRVGRLPYQLVTFLDADAAPTIVPVRVQAAGPDGLRLRGPAGLLPAGQRRAGLLAHDYHPKLVGLTTRYLTGWMEVADSSADGSALYAPHTDKGFSAPPNKTVLLLINGLVTKRGVRAAMRRGELPQLPTPLRHSDKEWRPSPD